MMTLLLADDEKLARIRLRSLLEELNTVQIVAEAVDGLDVLQKYQQTQPDIVLLDIRMPQLDGLEVAKELARFEQPPLIIFTTAYNSHALQAFEAQAIDYLLKPIRKDRLILALEKAQLLLQGRHAQLSVPTQSGRSHLCVQLGNSIQRVALNDILFFHADQKYVSAHSLTQHYLLDDSLKNLEEEFAASFMRIHRNALVALQYIAELHTHNGQTTVHFAHFPHSLPVSRRLVSEVKTRFKNFQAQQFSPLPIK